MSPAPLQITLGIVNFNGLGQISETLRCAQASTPPAEEILVIDNGSTDGSAEAIAENFPNITLIRSPENLGSAKARNLLLEKARHPYVMLLDHDISLRPDTLERLYAFMNATPEAGACHPEIEDPQDPEVHHYNGGGIHYLGALISREKPAAERRMIPEAFVTVSGAALMVRAEASRHVGGMDPDYFFNWEDGDFTCRLTLAGHPCYNLPVARVLHRSKPRGLSKAFYQVRNRWYFILKLYDRRTLVLILPMLALFEAVQMTFLHLKGEGGAYWKANAAVWKSLPAIRQKRRHFKSIKLLSDRAWLKAGKMYVPPSFCKNKPLLYVHNALNTIFSAYWALIRIFLASTQSEQTPNR